MSRERIVFYAASSLTIGDIITLFGPNSHDYVIDTEDDVVVIREPNR